MAIWNKGEVTHMGLLWSPTSNKWMELSDFDPNSPEGRKSLSRATRGRGRGKAVVWLDVDVASVTARLKGITAQKVASDPVVIGFMMDSAKKVQREVRPHVLGFFKNDPLEAHKSVLAAFTNKRKKGYPEVFVTTMRQAHGNGRYDKVAPDRRKHKGNFGKRRRNNRLAERVATLYGLDRGFIVNVFNKGSNLGSHRARGFFVRPTRAGLNREAPIVGQKVMTYLMSKLK